jgi:Z1 domain
MQDNIEKIVSFVKQVVDPSAVNLDALINEKVSIAQKLWDIQLNDNDQKLVIDEIKDSLRITIKPSGRIVRNGWKPWLHLRSDIQKEDFYSKRYRYYLNSTLKLPPKVVHGIFNDADLILDCLSNPLGEENFKKKGLVIGHVQSGKTANYIGLINKAADVGYKLIILIAGVHNNLRSQTQERINEGFIGFDNYKKEEIGVGIQSQSDRMPVSFTDKINDFKKIHMQSITFDPVTSKVPVILVIKKNSHTLRSIIDWLKADSKSDEYAKHYPVLLIDDEADNASINTKKNPDEATKINEQIRQILKLFSKISYVGYTATPFANIFIDPYTDNEMLGDDLFPDDFIISLEAPNNYIGANEIFHHAETKNPYIRIVNDLGNFPIPIPKDYIIEELPESLFDAVNQFLLSIALKEQRGVSTPHTSMLVNISHRKDIQEQARFIINQYTDNILRIISLEAYKPLDEMLNNKKILALYNLWSKEYLEEGDFQVILKTISKKRDLIKVALINGDSNDRLNYKEYKNDGGLHVIAVGGYSLSRGFTLEGLTISYFLRNSIMYDTLLQMGRWFGYRDKYKDLCRVFLTMEASDWYSHISIATDELRSEVKIMQQHKLTPRDYGLKVRSHPDGLIVTARNKMYSGSKIIESGDLSEQLIEVKALSTKTEDLNQNITAFRNILYSLPLDNKKQNETLWLSVDVSIIEKFINSFVNHPLSLQTEKQRLLKYIDLGRNKELKHWDVYLAIDNPTGVEVKGLLEIEKAHIEPDQKIKSYKRTLSKNNQKHDCVLFMDGGGRIVRIWEESKGLSKQQLEEARIKVEEDAEKESRQAASQTSRYYRKIRQRPLLVLKSLEVVDKDEKVVLFDRMIAYGISFPSSNEQRHLGFIANKIFIESLQYHNDSEDENED